VVANRISDADAVGDAELRRFLGSAPAARIPNDYAAASASVNQGVGIAELAPGGALARAFARLARDVHGWCGLRAPDEPAGLGRRLAGLLPWRKHGTR
jgi:Flp pilus assembly CpaE family ATPase